MEEISMPYVVDAPVVDIGSRLGASEYVPIVSVPPLTGATVVAETVADGPVPTAPPSVLSSPLSPQADAAKPTTAPIARKRHTLLIRNPPICCTARSCANDKWFCLHSCSVQIAGADEPGS